MMAGWLQSAANAWGRGSSAADAPVPFELECHCGHVVSGVRREDSQRIGCPQCGAALFVLPLDVYPQPKPKKAPKPPKTREPATDAEPNSSGGRRASFGSSDELFAPAQSRATSAAASPGEREFRRRLAKLRPRMTAVRGLTLAILTILFATGIVVRQAKLREQAELVLRTRGVLVEEFLQREDGPKLEEELIVHAQAIARLGRNDDDSLRTIALLRETMAATRLSSSSLFDLLREVESAMKADAGGWEDRFELLHRGRWMILDAPLDRRIDDAGRATWIVDMPLAAGDVPIRFEANLNAFSEFTDSSEGIPLLFAAQLDSFRLPQFPGGPIVVRFAPETGFLWNRPESLPLVGLARAGEPADETLEKRLMAQRTLGTPPDWEVIHQIQLGGLPKRPPEIQEELVEPTKPEETTPNEP